MFRACLKHLQRDLAEGQEPELVFWHSMRSRDVCRREELHNRLHDHVRGEQVSQGWPCLVGGLDLWFGDCTVWRLASLRLARKKKRGAADRPLICA